MPSPSVVGRAARVAVLVAGALAVAGCFTYVPTRPDAVEPGAGVRVRLSREGLARLPQVPDAAGGVLDGTLVRALDGDVTVRMPLGSFTEGVVSRSVGQDVDIAGPWIVAFERRELSRTRTALVAVGAALAAVLAARRFGDDDPEGGGTTTPPEESIRIPLLILP